MATTTCPFRAHSPAPYRDPGGISLRRVAAGRRLRRLLIDLDGVVWIGREPVPGSPEALAALLAAGKEIVFVTNNPARPPAAYAERLRGSGSRSAPSGSSPPGWSPPASPREAAGPDGGAFVIGARPLKEMVAAAGLRPCSRARRGREASVVVVSGHRGFDYDGAADRDAGARRAAPR